MTDTAALNYRWAWQMLDGLAAAGLSRIVVSPGSRSTPLALAALRHPELTTHVVIDERSAAFFALGAAKAGGGPVALVATSGSAVANWLPAVVEADMARVPLILLSADRPPELQGRGANQTMDQAGLFGGHVRACHLLPPAEAESGWLAELAARAVAASLGPLPGPVHINLPFREPLVPAAGSLPPPRAAAPRWLGSAPQPDRAALDCLRETLASGAGAIVCGAEDLGEDFRAAVLDLAVRLKVPVLADVLSGLRFDPRAGETVLGYPDQVARTAPVADWLLRFGGTPVSRPLADWLGRCAGRPQIVVSGHSRFTDAAATATHILHADPAALCRSLEGPGPAPDAWLDGFLARDRAAGEAAERITANPQPFEGGFFRALLRELPEGAPVFFGNSLAVRSADWFGGRGARRLCCFGNRGVSGIDGNLSTAFGIAAALGPTVAVVGDLAFLHDLNALALNAAAPLVVVVLDNGGGGIFDHLAQAGLPEFETGWLAPQTLDIAAACRAFALPCRRAETVGDAVAAVLSGLAGGRAGVVHLPLSREYSLAQVRAFHSACREGA